VHYLWAEAKKGTQDVFEMLTQLIITCKKTYDKGDYLAPPFIGCFDTEKIAFVDFHVILPIFTTNDFNWNTTPSNHEASDFQKARGKIINLILAHLAVYRFGGDDERKSCGLVVRKSRGEFVRRPATFLTNYRCFPKIYGFRMLTLTLKYFSHIIAKGVF
jgi:hypothetical protein